MAGVTPPVTAPVKALPARVAVFRRLFAIQASWNYQRMQGIGFGYASEPALRRLDGGRDGDKYKDALARESQFFNAHPYLAGLAVGAALRAEFDGQPKERIARLREALCGPLGSVGDRMFWASWLPICAAVAIVLVALGARGWAVVAFLVLYNAAHLYCRWWALGAGWERGMQVAGALATPAMKMASRLAAPVAGVVVGLALPLAMSWQLRGTSSRVALWSVALALAVALSLKVLRGKASGVAAAAGLLGATWLVGWLLWR